MASGFSWDEPTLRTTPRRSAQPPPSGYDAVFGSGLDTPSSPGPPPTFAPTPPMGGLPYGGRSKPETSVNPYTGPDMIGGFPHGGGQPKPGGVNPYSGPDAIGGFPYGGGTKPGGVNPYTGPDAIGGFPHGGTKPGDGFDAPPSPGPPPTSGDTPPDAGPIGPFSYEAPGKKAPAGEGGPTGSPTPYAQTMTQLQQTQDPQQQAVLKDKLARDVFTTLKTAGHDVKWNGDQLMVDGRPYVVGGGAAASTAAGYSNGQNTGVAGAPGAVDAARAANDQGYGQAAMPQNGAAPLGDEWAASNYARRQSGLPPQSFEEYSALPRMSQAGRNPNQMAGTGFTTGGGPGAGTEPGPYTPVPGATTNTPGATTNAGGTVGQYGMPAGAQPDKFNNPDYHSGKYDLLRIISKYPPTKDGLTQAMSEINALGYGQASMIGNDKISWNGDTIDLIRDSDGMNPSWWFGSEQEYAKGHPGAGGGGRVLGASTQGAAGVGLGSSYDTVFGPNATANAMPGTTGNPGAMTNTGAPVPPPTSQDPFGGTGVWIGNGWVPGNHPLAIQFLAQQAAGGATTPGTGPATPNTGPYTPGDIGMGDIPTFSWDQLAHQGDAPTDQATNDLVSSILQHPESMDPRTVEMMKAKSKDELAQMQATSDADLRAQGGALGIGDSPWLQSERNAGARARDIALVKSNRDIETGAAVTNAADRRSAAQLGSQVSSAQGARKLAGAQLAADTTLRAAAARGDRMALRENLKVKAAELGLSEKQLNQNMAIAQLQEAGRRYGIDVGASIQRLQLGQAHEEFLADLNFRLLALGQNDAQFGASFGLQTVGMQHQIDEDMWKRFMGTSGA